MKSKEELNAIKNEAVELGKKLSELNDEELKQIVGGHAGLPKINPDERYVMTIGVKADGGIEFKQVGELDKQYDIHIYDEDPSKRRFDPPKFIG